MDEARSSSLLSSTLRAIGFTLGGLVAGEGSFIVSERRERFRDASPRLRFIFQVAMASRDRALLEALQTVLGCGTLRTRPGRSRGHSEMTIFAVTALSENLARTVPFADHFLLPCHKRSQYDDWRARLASYDAVRPRRHPHGRSVCRIVGCDAMVRGRGLCRHHYYRATGH